jgi:hypothetical protein
MGFWSPWEAAKHITFRELRAVRLFVQFYLDRLRGRRLLLYEDNQAVVAMLASRRSSEPLGPNWVGVCVSEQRAPVPRGAVAPCLFVCQLCVSLSVFFLVCVCAQQP